jgi:hypothetical protein
MRLIYTLCAGRLAGDSAGGDRSGISIFLFAVFPREARKKAKQRRKVPLCRRRKGTDRVTRISKEIQMKRLTAESIKC